jgi:hypothetical protein
MLPNYHYKLTIAGAQNSTQTICGALMRYITYITPIVTGIPGGFAIISVVELCFAKAGNFASDDLFAVAALVSALPMDILSFHVCKWLWKR